MAIIPAVKYPSTSPKRSTYVLYLRDMRRWTAASLRNLLEHPGRTCLKSSPCHRTHPCHAYFRSLRVPYHTALTTMPRRCASIGVMTPRRAPVIDGKIREDMAVLRLDHRVTRLRHDDVRSITGGTSGCLAVIRHVQRACTCVIPTMTPGVRHDHAVSHRVAASRRRVTRVTHRVWA